MNREDKLKEAAETYVSQIMPPFDRNHKELYESVKHDYVEVFTFGAKSEAARQYHNEWIPVSDSVPKPDQRFDAWHSSGHRITSQLFIGYSEVEIKDTMNRCGYTHWKPEPLPPAPKD